MANTYEQQQAIDIEGTNIIQASTTADGITKLYSKDMEHHRSTGEVLDVFGLP